MMINKRVECVWGTLLLYLDRMVPRLLADKDGAHWFPTR